MARADHPGYIRHPQAQWVQTIYNRVCRDTEEDDSWDVQEPKKEKKGTSKKAQEPKGAKNIEYSDEEREWLDE